MKRRTSVVLVFLSLVLSSLVYAEPDLERTPGKVCTQDDPDFSHFAYPEHIAICYRGVSFFEKKEVAKDYGIPQSEWRNYEFDHLIPLCAGGANGGENVWPQLLIEAHKKDVLENQICRAMRLGQLSQKEAIEKVYSWFFEQQEQALNSY